VPCAQAFNKTDVASHQFAVEWMSDFEQYQAALDSDKTYAATLSRSLSLVLDEFYANLRCAGVSAVTGMGMEELFKVRGCLQLGGVWRYMCKCGGDSALSCVWLWGCLPGCSWPLFGFVAYASVLVILQLCH
jgi:hypothetical protein